MTLMQVLIALAIAGLIVGGVVLLLGKKRLPLPPLPILRARSPEERLQEEAALLELARRAVSTYPELGSTPDGLLAEIDSYCKRSHSYAGRTSRLILEKMLAAGSLRQARSYWQVNAFLEDRDKLKKSGQAQ